MKLLRIFQYGIAALAAMMITTFAALRSEIFTGAEPLQKRSTETSNVLFKARAILAVSDADMVASAYADGRLRRRPNTVDQLTIIQPGEDTTKAQRSAVAVPSTVLGWPGAIDASPDRRFAYVVEGRKSPPPNIDRYSSVTEEMPFGRHLAVVGLADLAVPKVLMTTEIGDSPGSVHVAPSGRWLLVTLKEADAPIAFVSLQDGLPQSVIKVPLALPNVAQRAYDTGAVFGQVSPAGDIVALNIANTHLAFAKVVFDDAGKPQGAHLIGRPMRLNAKWISMLRWSKDGRHLLVADVGWGPKSTDAVLNGPGYVLSIAFDPSGQHREVSRTKVSLSPEAFEMSPQGDLIIAVNMERTSLPPSGFPFILFGRQSHHSLSLVAFDAITGGLRTIDGPIMADGVLPEDAVFDNDGKTIAVVVYHERSEAPLVGWLQYYEIERGADAPRLRPTNARTMLPRGAHDLIVLR
jgi:hypothetical protein